MSAKETYPHLKINSFLKTMKHFLETMNNDLNQLSTGNLAHHKASMKGKLDNLKYVFDNVRPTLEQQELRLLDEVFGVWCQPQSTESKLNIDIVTKQSEPLPDEDHIRLKDNGFDSLTNALNKLKGNGG